VYKSQDNDGADDDNDADNEESEMVEASREKPRNVPASICAKPPVTGAGDEATAVHDETPIVQFGTRKRSAITLLRFCTLIVCFFGHRLCAVLCFNQVLIVSE